MTTGITTPGYSHKQTAPLCLILYGVGIAAVPLAVLKGEELHGMILFHYGDDSEFVATRTEAKGN